MDEYFDDVTYSGVENQSPMNIDDHSVIQKPSVIESWFKEEKVTI